MTFADWQAKYPGVKIVYPYPEAPTVAMVTDHTGALRELYTLEDYKVTSDMLKAHYGPTVWLAPRDAARDAADDWTRADYMNHLVSHEDYYQSLARCIGWDALARMVSWIATPAELARAVQSDRHLNAIPLHRWDAVHPSVLQIIREHNRSNGIMARSWCGQPLQPGTICWSLSESVCVVKAVARVIALEEIDRQAREGTAANG